MLLQPPPLANLLRPAILLIFIASVITGIALAATPAHANWTKENTTGLIYWVTIFSLSSACIRILFKQHAAAITTALTLVFLLAGAGLVPSLIALALLSSMYCSGKFLFFSAFKKYDSKYHWKYALVIGLSAYLMALSCMVHLAINYRAVYILILLLPLAAEIYTKEKRISLWITSKERLKDINQLLVNMPYFYLCSALACIGYVGSFAFIPSLMADDNNYHLSMWSQLTFYHRYLFDVVAHKWAVAPFSGDVLHGFISVIANEDGRASLNILFFIFLLLGVAYISNAFFACIKNKFFVITLFVSTPIIANLLGGLQTELFVAVLTTLAVGSIINTPHNDKYEEWLFIFLISCILVSIKLPAIIIALSLFICLFVKHRGEIVIPLTFTPVSPWFIATIIMGCCLALHSYINAYFITGNPTFPLYNAIFKSPFYPPENFSDETFKKGANFTAFLGFFFNSPKYFESGNFIAGFQYLLLPLLGFFYLFNSKNAQKLYILIIPVVIFGGIMFWQMQYWRYLFPTLPLLSILAAAPFILLQSKSIGILAKITTYGIFLFYITINFYYLPNASFLFSNNQMLCFSASEKDSLQKKNNPEFFLNNYMNENHPGESVLMELSEPNGATLWGKPVYAKWISPLTFIAFNNMKNADELKTYLQNNHIYFIYWNEQQKTNGFHFRALIKEVINRYGTEETQSNNTKLYRLHF